MRTANHLIAPDSVGNTEDAIPVFARWFGSWRVSLQRRALSSPQLARSYDLAAPGWSRKLDRIGVPGAYERLLCGVLGPEGLSQDAPANDGASFRVLDCGVGTGALSGALANVRPGPFWLDAIDISPRMLEQAGRALRASGVAVTLRQGDVRCLPYGSGLFDIALTGHVLEHLADPRVALNEMVRVLKPGGLLIACLTRRSAPGAYVQLMWRTHRVSPDEAASWLSESGLETVRSHSYGRRGYCHRLSLACSGRKPLAVGGPGSHATSLQTTTVIK